MDRRKKLSEPNHIKTPTPRPEKLPLPPKDFHSSRKPLRSIRPFEKRTDLLEQSATELDRLHSAGKLSEEGHDALDEIIQSARDEEWMPGAKSLKAFMLGQRKTAN